MKKKQPYFPLYAQDVLAHPRLTACSVTTCGVYFFLLCIMHQQEEPGVYCLWEKAQGDPIVCLSEQLCRQTPFRTSDIESALRELIRFKILVFDGKALLDQGIVEWNELSAKRASAGSKGGSQNHHTQTESKTCDFACEKTQAKVQANSEYEYEIENEIEYDNQRIEGVQGEEGETNEKPDTVQRVEDNGFEKLWQAYPRKAEKAAARKAYVARIRDGWSPPELYAAVEAYAAQCRAEKREQRYIKHGAVFLGASTPFADYIPHSPPEDEEDDLKECF